MYRKALMKPVLTGMLVAAGVVLSEFLAITLPPTATPVIRFSIGYLPIIVAGVLFGPVYGGVAGAVQDLLGFFLFGAARGYAFHPGYTLNAILYGVLPALLLRHVRGGDRKRYLILNFIAAGVLFGLATWFFFDIDAVYSSSLSAAAKTLLAGFALVGAGGLAVFNFLIRKRARMPIDPARILFVVVLMYALTSLVLTPVWLWTTLPGYSIWLALPLRLLKMPVEAAFYVLLLTPLVNLAVRLLPPVPPVSE